MLTGCCVSNAKELVQTGAKRPDVLKRGGMRVHFGCIPCTLGWSWSNDRNWFNWSTDCVNINRAWVLNVFCCFHNEPNCPTKSLRDKQYRNVLFNQSITTCEYLSKIGFFKNQIWIAWAFIPIQPIIRNR